MRRSAAFAVAALAALAWSPTATADEDEARIERLERRVAELETALDDSQAAQAGPPRNDTFRNWAERVRLSGSASAGYFHHGDLTPPDADAFIVRDARLFVDAELWSAPVESQALARNVGFSFEWNLVRLGTLANDVGDLFVEFQGIGGSSWLNVQVGRFQIPVGEAYLRYGRGAADNPFVSNPVGGPWWWDEGLRFYGASDAGAVGYVASLTNGDSWFNENTGDLQGSLKLFARPLGWLTLSASGLVSGESGAAGSPANASLWLGETWGRAFGAGTPIASVADGALVAAGPPVLDRTWLVAADAVATPWTGVRAWLGWGRFSVDSSGGSFYDRVLSYWIAELLVDGDVVSARLAPLYAGVRSSGITTGDAGRGYLLDVRYTPTLGYNMEALLEHSVVIGWRLGRSVVIRSQYDLREIDLVRGAAAVVTDTDGLAHGFSFDVGVSF